jgi:hypothetical protein
MAPVGNSLNVGAGYAHVFQHVIIQIAERRAYPAPFNRRGDFRHDGAKKIWFGLQDTCSGLG